MSRRVKHIFCLQKALFVFERRRFWENISTDRQETRAC